MVLSWDIAPGWPEDWASTVAQWPGRGPRDEEIDPAQVHMVRATHAGTTVGVHLAVLRRTGQMQSLWCAVDPAWRGRGVAQRLISHHLAWAASEGRHDVRAHTPAACPAMIVANLKSGFEVAGSFTDPSDEVILILQARPI